MKPNIELHIEELLLQGFKPGDRYEIGEAVEQELIRLIAERGLSDGLIGNVQIPHLNGGSFRIGTDSKPETTGALIARSVYETMSGKR